MREEHGGDETDGELRRLIRSCAAGDHDAMGLLLDRAWALVYRTCLAVLRDPGRAEGCATETFVSIWHRAGTYADGLGSPRSWLATLAYLEARRAMPLAP